MRTKIPRLLITLFAINLVLLQSCNSPFQPEQVYSPELVLYGIAFRGDSTLEVRVAANSISQIKDSSYSSQIKGLTGTLFDSASGLTTILSSDYENGTNTLHGRALLQGGTIFKISVQAPGYLKCSASLTVLDSGIIYPAYYTTAVMQDPNAGGQPDPQFTIYPSNNAFAIRLTMALDYSGVDPDNKPVSGEIDINPSYQTDSTSYFLRINGVTTGVKFNLSDYSKAYEEALGKITSGTVTAVVRLEQIDASLYDFYSISNGFNDPLTMQTEKPVFTNVINGLGFFSSVSNDSLIIGVYP